MSWLKPVTWNFHDLKTYSIRTMLWIQHSWNVWARKGQTRFAVPKTQLYPINSCRSNSTTEPASYSFLTRPVSQPKSIWTGLNQCCPLYISTTSIHPLTKNRQEHLKCSHDLDLLYFWGLELTQNYSASVWEGAINISGRIKCFSEREVKGNINVFTKNP